MGNWNSRNQGPLPGNGFAPFPPQFGHPPGAGGGGFPGMGQQFPGPPIFPGGGGRPPMDMGFGGGRFLGPGGHMGEGGDGYLGPGRGAGWHGPGEVDDGRGPPLLGPGDGWEGPGPHGDDRHRHGRMEWERGGPIGVRGGWERDREREMWEAQRRDGAPDFMPHRGPQMDPPPQIQAFPSAGTGWGVIQRDNSQVPNDLKPRQDRQPFDVQEAKRKPDGGGPPKPKVIKSNSRGAVSTSEGKLAKYATATMQSVLSQLDISPELAGPELYAQFRALLPASASAGKQSSIPEEREYSMSELKDEDLNLEVDPEAEALIAGPNLLAKLLPPLPDGVFEEALRLYRKPEAENRVQKSSRGCFVLPFDPSTVKVPSISLRLDRYNIPGKGKDEPHNEVGRLLDQLEINGLGAAEFAEEFMKRSDGTLLNAAQQGQEGEELEGAEIEDGEGEAMQDDEFISSHVEVAEYSDREFEAEMEDTLEYDSLKDMPVGGGALSETLDPGGEDKDSVDHMTTVYKESIDPVVDTLVDHAKESLTDVDNNLQLMGASKSESVVAEVEDDRVDNMVVEVADHVDNVVVKVDQLDNVVVDTADQVDSVVEADQVDNAVVEAYQVGSAVVEADQVGIAVVEAYQVDSAVVEADQVDNAVVEADQVGSAVVEADQVDNVVDEDQVDNLVGEDQVDNLVDKVDQVDDMVDEAPQQVDNPLEIADVGENVNSFVVSKGAVNYDNTDEPEKNNDVVVEEEVKISVEETGVLEVTQSYETLQGEFEKSLNVRFSVAEIRGESSVEVPVSKAAIQAAAEETHEENLETKQGTGVVEDETQEALASVDGKKDDLNYVEELGLPEPMNGGGNGLDVKQDPPLSRATESIENHVPEEVLTTIIGQDDVRMETNGKLKEIVENSPAPEEEPVIEEPKPEPLTRLRKRRASTRLLAQQSAEAQQAVQARQEPSDALEKGQGSVGTKKSGSRGTTRSSQRRSKRRGSTH